VFVHNRDEYRSLHFVCQKIKSPNRRAQSESAREAPSTALVIVVVVDIDAFDGRRRWLYGHDIICRLLLSLLESSGIDRTV
jgi:hypothetical protein